MQPEWLRFGVCGDKSLWGQALLSYRNTKVDVLGRASHSDPGPAPYFLVMPPEDFCSCLTWLRCCSTTGNVWLTYVFN